MKYTTKQLDDAAMSDLLSDAEQSERQAVEGPFYPHLGITAETCRQYAAECRDKLARYSAGGAHAGILAE